jgi:hypothetical protein
MDRAKNDLAMALMDMKQIYMCYDTITILSLLRAHTYVD